MKFREITCDSLLKRITKKDILFNGDYCIDPYQNCEFGCMYCDSSFDKTVYVKTNADKILEKELKQLKKGVIIVGSVHDPYQKAEEKYEITKNLLKIIKKYNFPCHILTKSTLILRDINLLSSMQCMVTISLVSTNDGVANIFEKNVPSPLKRLQVVKKLTENKIKTGVALMPLLPHIVDPELDDIVKEVVNCNGQYFLHNYLELKGDQKIAFREIIKKYYPDLLSKYEELYKNNLKPDKKYTLDIDNRIYKYCKKYNIPKKII